MISAMFILHFWVMRAIYYFTASRCTIYVIWVENTPNQRKNEEKATKYFSPVWFCLV